MKPLFTIADLTIANPIALRSHGHGPAACGLLRRERDAMESFID